MLKKISYLISALVILVTSGLAAQTSEETRSLQSFNAVKISNSIEAELVKGDKNEMHISASGIELDRISSETDKQTLVVKINGSNFGATSVKVTITYKDISEVTANTSAKVFVQSPLTNKTVKINAASSSYIEAEVNTQDLVLDATTNAKIFLKGTAHTLDLKAHTNAEIDGSNLEADDVKVKVNTAAQVTFTVNESIKGSAATAGKVRYKGDPNMVDVKTNTAGAIEREI